MAGLDPATPAVRPPLATPERSVARTHRPVMRSLAGSRIKTELDSCRASGVPSNRPDLGTRLPRRQERRATMVTTTGGSAYDSGMKRLSIGSGLRGQAMIAAGALGLIALIWLGSIAALRANRAEVEAHAAAEIADDALIFADQMDAHLTAIDQTLSFLGRDWEANPDSFDLPSWRQRAVLLADAALQVFVTDANGVVRQATDAALVGRNVSDRSFFRNRAALPSDDGHMYIGKSSQDAGGQGWVLNLSRRLDLPDGTFAGVINVTYDVSELNRYFDQAGLGKQGLMDLVDEADKMLLATVGGGAKPGQSIAGTAMLQAMTRTPDGRWIGPSAPDGVQRVHAFHQLPDRGLELVLAMSERDALRPAMAWERQALVFVSLTTVLVMLVAAALLVQARAARQRVATLAQARRMLAAAKADADAQSQRLEVTLAGMSDGVMMMDADLRLVEWNDRFPEMIGLPPNLPFRGMSMEHVLSAQARAGEFGPVDVEAEVAARIAAIRAGGDSVTTERTRPDGRALAVRRRRLADGSFVTIYTDVTERKRNEDALRQARLLAEATSEAKSRFVAMVSHEIRQPLNALLNSLSLLAGTEIGAAPRRLLRTAQQSGEALLGLLNDILEMSKMEAGQLTLRPDVFALAPLLQGVLDMFADQAAARGMRLTLAIADTTPARLQADPARIRQILVNLVSNAVKFASPGPVVLAATVERDMPAMLRLTVRDPGPAIDPAGRARLFQPFVQLGGSAGGAYAGTGLGLAICQTLAGLLGGEIGYEPTEAGGNAFWVRLAFELPAGQKAAPPPRPIYPRTRVLLVEDIRANQLVIATLLRREGHMVDVAASGSAAIRAASRQPYDLVLMDIFMPGMTGAEATRHIRALPGPAGAVPICALTGNVSAEDRARCEAAGMNDMLVKPVELDALIAVLGRLVWRHRPAWQPEGDLEPPVEQPVLPLLMHSRLAELRAHLSPATVSDLVEQAIADIASRLAPLRAAAISRDAAGIEAEAHAMAGVAGGYAMAALEFRLQAIVEAARAGGLRTAASLCADIDSLFNRSAAALREAVAAAVA
jgi:signal transduction histidine kinase/DNA-binding response OmpR family regulator